MSRCEFCLVRNSKELCHKLPSAANERLTIPFVPALESVGEFLHHDDAMLLHHGYSEEFVTKYHRIGCIFRTLSGCFQRSIHAAALRYSMLAYISDTLGGEISPAKKAEYQAIAQRVLGQNLKNPSSVTVADLFASYLLCYRLPWKSPTAIRHYQGCISIHKFLLNNLNPATESSQLFTLYGPFILDELNVWLNTELSVQIPSVQSIRLNFPPFGDLIQHFGPFRSKEVPILDSAAYYTLQYCMDLLLLSIQCVVGYQTSIAWDVDVVSAARLGAVVDQFYTPELQQFLRVAEALSDEALSRKIIKDKSQLIVITSLCLCVKIGIQILTSRDILGVLQRKPAFLCTSKLVNYLKGLAECDYSIDMLCLLTAGMGLGQDGSLSGTSMIAMNC
jgi:hypothetical protein